MHIKSSVYKYYKKLHIWKNHECIGLLGGIDPKPFACDEDILDLFQPKDLELGRAINQAVKDKGLALEEGIGFNSFKFIEWAQRENLIIPDVSTAPEWCPIKNVKRKE